MTSVQQALLDLKKPTTEAIKKVISTLIIDVCNRASTVASTASATATSEDNSSEVNIDASSARHNLVVNLLSCKNNNNNQNNNNSSTVAAASPAMVEKAYALVCVIDRILTYRGGQVVTEFSLQDQKLDPQLVSAAWNVLTREIEAELPVVVASVIESYSQKQAVQSVLKVKRWLNDRYVSDETGREALFRAVNPSKKQQQQQEDKKNQQTKKNSGENEEDDDAVEIFKNGNNNNNVSSSSSSSSSSSAKSFQNLTSAEARKRIELLKHLCDGLENIPTPTSLAASAASASSSSSTASSLNSCAAEILALRSSFVEFGSEAASNTGGARRWGASAGSELRALSAALTANVTSSSSSSSETIKKKNVNQDGENNNDEEDEQEEDEDQEKEENSKRTEKLLFDACESIDNVLRALKKKTAEQQLQQQQQDAASAAAASSSSHHTINKKPPVPVPAYSCLVLDRSELHHGRGAVAARVNDTPATIRGPREAPEIITPFAVPARLSSNGERASREWYSSPDNWARARASTNLKWVLLTSASAALRDEEESNNNNNDDASNNNSKNNENEPKRISPEAGAEFFFG